MNKIEVPLTDAEAAVPCLTGTRIPIDMLLADFAEGMTIEEIGYDRSITISKLQAGMREGVKRLQQQVAELWAENARLKQLPVLDWQPGDLPVVTFEPRYLGDGTELHPFCLDETQPAGRYVTEEYAKRLQQQLAELKQMPHCGYPNNENQITHCGCKLCSEIQEKFAELTRQLGEAKRGSDAWTLLVNGIASLQDMPSPDEPRDVWLNAYIEKWTEQKQRAESAERANVELRAENERLKQLPVLDWQPAEVARTWPDCCQMLVKFSDGGCEVRYLSLAAIPENALYARL